MKQKAKKHKTIGLVLSTVPKYSETFFRNKIKGLQKHGFEVILFVDYFKKGDADFSCKIVAANNYSSVSYLSLWHSFKALVKSAFIHPARSLRLFRLNKKDKVTFTNNIKQLVLNQFILAENVDWLHFGFGMLAVNRENVANAMHAKMAVSFRGFDLYLSPLKHKNCYKVLFKKAIRYHVLSNEMKHDLMAYAINSNQIQVITPAIDTKLFQSEKSPSNSKQLQLVTVARQHWKKGFIYTLEALAYLKQKGIDFQYTIIGAGSEQERITFAAYQLGVLENITFTGKLPQEEVKATLEQSSIYIQYSIQEGFCNAVLEAQALGLLCVVSNAEGLSENILDKITGWVVPKRQPILLAEKIIEIINLPEDIKKNIRTTAIERVKNEFNLEKQQDEFVRFYQN
ncbi:glycosyltransferase family 4 protein [Winogradskyella eckloniae]|uniref:glycosyltransferase family 4 protein n=1 Tax=Winogradskyella eckloniae TaxID=1089306 RepID=UPI0015657DCF|nr:glycosyltransferase family 4 protein [Winogradskyella eckloniae]NRD20547.1 glycosyltransferase family 4 protein [Winogradskyella eckloniae]